MAKASGAQKPRPREAGTLKIHALMEKCLVERSCRLAGGAVNLQIPRVTMRGGAPGGKAHHRPQANLGKGLERTALRTFGRRHSVRWAGSGVAFPLEAGNRWRRLSPVPFRRGSPWGWGSSSTGPQIPGCPSRQSQRSCDLPGTGGSGAGTGQQELSCHWRRP